MLLSEESLNLLAEEFGDALLFLWTRLASIFAFLLLLLLFRRGCGVRIAVKRAVVAVAESSAGAVVMDYNLDCDDVASVGKLVVNETDNIMPDAAGVDFLVFLLGDGAVCNPTTFRPDDRPRFHLRPRKYTFAGIEESPLEGLLFGENLYHPLDRFGG